MTISMRLTTHGWWAAFICPAGLAGKPDADAGYCRVNVNSEFTFYIDEKIMGENLRDRRLGFYIEGYGRFELEFEAKD